MNLIEVEKKHQQEWTEFQKLKSNAWEQIEGKIEKVHKVFGKEHEKIPDAVRTRIDADKKKWHNIWGQGGEKEKALYAIQKIERNACFVEAKQNALRKIREAKKRNKDYKEWER